MRLILCLLQLPWTVTKQQQQQQQQQQLSSNIEIGAA